MTPRRAALASAAAFLFFFGFFLRSLSPAFHPDDSAETITAGATLSFQHPPGYPLHSLLGFAATKALPGSPAFGVNALSGFLAAAGLLVFLWVVGLLAALFRGEEEADLGLGLFAALALMMVKELWFQASIAKGGIYALNFALTQVEILALLMWRKNPGAKALGLLFLAFGLGMANHWTSQVVLAPGLALILWEAWSANGRPRVRVETNANAGAPLQILRSAAWVLPGLSLYLYLPIRAARHPVLPWGDPGTWEGFWWIFNRSQYAGVESGKTWDSFHALISRVASNLGFEFHWAGLLGLAILWLLLFRRNWMLSAGLLLLPLTLTLAVCFKAKPPADSPWIIDPYLVPLYSGLALGFAGLSLADWRARLALPALAALLFFQHKALSFQRDNYLGWDYVSNLLVSCPKHALMFCEGDSNTAGPLYHRYVAGKRRDLAPVAVVLSDYDWYRRELAHHTGLKIPPSPLTPPGNISYLVAANPGRPPLISNSYTKEWVNPSMLAPRGLMNAMLKAPLTAADLARNRVWEAYAFRGVFEPAHAMDPLSVRLVLDNYLESVAHLAEAWGRLGRHKESEAEYARLGGLKRKWGAPWVQAGNMAWLAKDVQAAGRHWAKAVAEEPGSPEAQANLGLYHLEMKDYDRALLHGNEALALRPEMPNAKALVERARQEINRRLAPQVGVEDASQAAARGDMLAGQGRNEEALQAYAKAQSLGFDSANLHRNKAVLLARVNRMTEALNSMEKAVKMDPQSAELWKYLGVFRFNAGDFKGALQAFEKAKGFNAKDPELDNLILQAQAKLPK